MSLVERIVILLMVTITVLCYWITTKLGSMLTIMVKTGTTLSLVGQTATSSMLTWSAALWQSAAPRESLCWRRFTCSEFSFTPLTRSGGQYSALTSLFSTQYPAPSSTLPRWMWAVTRTQFLVTSQLSTQAESGLALLHSPQGYLFLWWSFLMLHLIIIGDSKRLRWTGWWHWLIQLWSLPLRFK